jgi:hypothetical protein
MTAVAFKEIAGFLWLGLFLGGLHLAYAQRGSNSVARKIVNGFKSLYRKEEDTAMRDWLILIDIIATCLFSLLLAGALIGGS